MTNETNHEPVRIQEFSLGAFRRIARARIRPYGRNTVLRTRPENGRSLLDALATGLAVFAPGEDDTEPAALWTRSGNDRRAFRHEDCETTDKLPWVEVKTGARKWNRKLQRDGPLTMTRTTGEVAATGTQHPCVVYYDTQRPLNAERLDGRQPWTSDEPERAAARMRHPANALPARGDALLLYAPAEDTAIGPGGRDTREYVERQIEHITSRVFRNTRRPRSHGQRPPRTSPWPWTSAQSGLAGITADLAWRTAMGANESRPETIDAIVLLDRIEQYLDEAQAERALEELSSRFPGTQWIVTTNQNIQPYGFDALNVETTPTDQSAGFDAEGISRATIVTSSS